MWPPDDELLVAWRRLTDDPSSFGAFADMTLLPLVNALAAKFPKTDPDDHYSAASDALLGFANHPQRYDPA